MDERPLIEILLERVEACTNLHRLVHQLDHEEVIIATGYVLKLIESRPNKTTIESRVKELGQEAWG